MKIRLSVDIVRALVRVALMPRAPHTRGLRCRRRYRLLESLGSLDNHNCLHAEVTATAGRARRAR